MWIITAWHCIPPEVNVKSFKKCCISKGVDETNDMLWSKSEEDGYVRSVSKMKAPIFKIETVTLIGKGTQNLTRFVYQVCEINSKIFRFI